MNRPVLRAAVPAAARLGNTGEAPEADWRPTPALGRAVLLTGGLLVAAVLLGRVDLVVLAVPFAVGTAFALRQRPTVAPRLGLRAADTHLVEGAVAHATVTVGDPDGAAYHLALVRVLSCPGPLDGWLHAAVAASGMRIHTTPWLRFARGDHPFAVTVPAGDVAEIELRGEALRWGRYPLGPAAVRALACDGLLASQPVIGDLRRVPVYPVTEPFDADEAMPRAAGLVGGHRSRRPGEGGELSGVRVFGPGDRLRRVDWRVSLRARQLHVAATLSDRDAEVVLLLDVLTEAGRSEGVRGTASVLDTTVRAAAAIGEHYLQRGDRVSMLEYGSTARWLRPATGRRQYLILLEWLLGTRVGPTPHEPYDQVFGPYLRSSNALVVVLTPLIDKRSAAMVARLARSGRFVVAVDTLPSTAAPPSRGRWTEVAYRLWRLDRDNVIGQLREHGVPVVRWAGAGSLDLVLRDVARLASAPRVVPR